MTVFVSVGLAKRLHAQQRPFMVELVGYDNQGNPVLNDDGIQLVVTFWTVWRNDGNCYAYRSTNNIGDVSATTTMETLFIAIEVALAMGYNHIKDTVYSELEARPRSFSDLPLLYKRIKRLVENPCLPHEDPTFNALDEHGEFLMTLTSEGAETLRAFNLNL